MRRTRLEHPELCAVIGQSIPQVSTHAERRGRSNTQRGVGCCHGFQGYVKTQPFWFNPFSLKRCIADACAEVLCLRRLLLRSQSAGDILRRSHRMGASFEGTEAAFREVVHSPESRRRLAHGEAIEIHSTQTLQCSRTRVQAQPRTRGRIRRRCGRGEEARGGDRSPRWRHCAYQGSPGSVAERSSQNQSASGLRASGSMQDVRRMGQETGSASLRGRRQSSVAESRARS